MPWSSRLTKEYGRLDVLVANVGQNLVRPAEDTTTQSWQQFIDINLSSAFYAVRAVLPTMLDAGSGRILLIGSSAVFDGGGGAIDYAAAKAGLVGMMRYLARNYTRHGIRTNVIHPAVIETDLLRERYGDAAKKQKLIDQVPIGRLGQPADIAGLAVFLASSWGDFICGQEILVDGGRTFYRGGPSSMKKAIVIRAFSASPDFLAGAEFLQTEDDYARCFDKAVAVGLRWRAAVRRRGKATCRWRVTMRARRRSPSAPAPAASH